MQYLALIHSDEDAWGALSTGDHGAMMEQYSAFSREGSEAGVIKGGSELAPSTTATTVRIRNDETLVTDGPFAETKEALGGYYLIEASDLDQALEIAKLCPAPFGGVEVRPIKVYPDE